MQNKGVRYTVSDDVIVKIMSKISNSECRGCLLSMFYLGEQDLMLMPNRESIPKDQLASSLKHTCNQHSRNG